MSEIYKSSTKAFKTGFAGGALQVTSLLWLRTANNYQYKHGTSLSDTIKTLYNQGGILRFYRGYFPSLFLGSSIKFGEINAYYYSKQCNFNELERLIFISSVSSLLKFTFVPIDTLDIFLQVEGKKGIETLKNKVNSQGVRVLYYGLTPWITSNFISTFCWYNIHNYLDSKFKNYGKEGIVFNIKNAIIGGIASVISDSLTNPLRILKIYKQSNTNRVSYTETYKNIVETRGYKELFLRGLKTRIIIHGLQNMFFIVVWKNLEKAFNI